jgi:hypothetical protein
VATVSAAWTMPVWVAPPSLKAVAESEPFLMMQKPPESTGTFYGRAMTAGNIYTVAGRGSQGFSGDGGPATSAELNQPFGVAPDSAGDLLIADVGNNRIRMVNG